MYFGSPHMPDEVIYALGITHVLSFWNLVQTLQGIDTVAARLVCMDGARDHLEPVGSTALARSFSDNKGSRKPQDGEHH